ncbi:hypothetical protein [Ideonella sp. BN130291]|uniref:hypothetical protein n=1 Tax=Ideonella sp. BN130291 TaxID=3112940 RepID=UPI002E26358A|nr:hypothetical protein [Ideonella sp. BN130291]
MRHATLQALTWATVTAAVTSALWLAAAEPGWPETRKPGDPAGSLLRLPSEPSGAGAGVNRPAPPRRDAGAPQRGERPPR